MSKTIKSLILLTAMVVMAVTAASAGDMAWFDMENCDMCKHMGENKELMMNISFEQNELSNGFISISTVKPESLPAANFGNRDNCYHFIFYFDWNQQGRLKISRQGLRCFGLVHFLSRVVLINQQLPPGAYSQLVLRHQ